MFAHRKASPTRSNENLALSAAELVETGRDLPCSSSTQGMTESNSSSIDIDLLWIELQLLHAVNVHAREGLVDFPEVDIRCIDPRSL